SLLPDPAAAPGPGAAVPGGYGPMLRALQLAQRLYHAGELISHGLASPMGEEPQVDATAGIVRDLVLGHRADPVVSCMACHAWWRVIDADPDASDARHALTAITHDVAGDFGALPDARLAAALLIQDERDALLMEMLDRNEVPILAEGTRLLGRYAEEHGRTETAAADLARRIPHDQIWTLTFLSRRAGDEPMSILDIFKSKAQKLTWRRLPDTQVVGGTTGKDIPKDEAYFVLRMKEMYVQHSRKLWRKYYPMLHGFTEHAGEEVHAVAGPGQL